MENRVKEKIQITTKTTKLSVAANEITAVLRAEDIKTGLRVYDGESIGIAGAIGSYDESALESRAADMLKYKLPYDCAPAEGCVKTLDLSQDCGLTDEQFIETSTSVLNELRRNYPEFAYNNIIRLTEQNISLTNSLGTELTYCDRAVSMELWAKHKESKNLFDTLTVNETRNYTADDAFRVTSMLCAHYGKPAQLEGERMPVVMLNEHALLLGMFYSDLHGERYGTDTSLFSGKIGQKLFGDDFSLYVNRDPRETYSCFFDGEGTTLADNRYMLIENGVLKAPYSNKKIAKRYNLPVTASASLIYDSVPNTAPSAFGVLTSGKTIKELLGGRKAVFVTVASGGDFTPMGEFASPVQDAYLFDGEKIYGRLPQLAISSNLHDMFGKDFIGISTDGYSPNSPFKYLAIEMNVKKL